MIALKKKPQAKKCSDHRTISLISHVGKIVARILYRRLEKKAEEILGEEQFGFRRGKGTRDAIGMMRIVSVRVLNMNENICVSFIDWKKAFDRVNWRTLINILREIGVDWRDRRLIQNLYLEQTIRVQLNQGETEGVQIGLGVPQGCCMLPTLFNIYGKHLAKEALKGLGDFKTGGRVINNMKYANDLVVLAREPTSLQKMMDRLVETGNKYGMEINLEKSKVMRISRTEAPIHIFVQNEKMEQVGRFKYLGSWIEKEGRCEKDVRTRIVVAKMVLIGRRHFLEAT